MKATLAARIERALRGKGPYLIVLAGSNGSGKSTFHARYLAALELPFVDADQIARRLTPDATAVDAYAAMQVAEAVRDDLLARRQSFCMETVFSDTVGAKLAFLQRARSCGYRVVLIHMLLQSVELSQARVRQRVLSGGHDVPNDKLIQRFPRTSANARKALEFVDIGLVIDNSSFAEPYRLLEHWERGRQVTDR